MSRQFAIALALLLPSLAVAQEAKKFNAKDLEKELAPLVAYSPKGGIVDNEAIVSVNPDYDSYEAVYVVKSAVKKVIDFYVEKLGFEPTREGEAELGTLRYHFALKIKQGDKRAYKVTVEPLEGENRVQIRLLRRAVTDDDVIAEESE